MELTELEFGVFSVGLGIGLLFTLIAWLNSFGGRSAMKKEIENLEKEIENLKKHLHISMSIHAKGSEEMEREMNSLKRENENLRITVATLSNKPGRAELEMLHTWDKAIKVLTLKSPAFAPAWEMAIEEARKEVEETRVGVKSLMRKVFLLLPQNYVN